MKRWALTVILAVLMISVSAGQTKSSVLIGIDVLKPVLSLATPNRPAYRLIEATVKIPLAQNYLSIIGGYGYLHSDTIYRNILLTVQGYYVKAGLEKQPPSGAGLILGWHGLLATCQERGTYFFKGPTFGDYVAPVPERQRVALGIEGVLGHQLILSRDLLLRISGRVTAATLIGPSPTEMSAYYIPGMGHTAGNTFVFTVGLGVHLLYQL